MTGPQITERARPDWHTEAACRGLNPDLFYGEFNRRLTADAKAVCATCPVRQECLDWAVTTVETHGIWGGMSPKERSGLRRRQPAVHGTRSRYMSGTNPCRCDACRAANNEYKKARYVAVGRDQRERAKAHRQATA